MNRIADILKDSIKDLIPQLAYLPRHYRELKFVHKELLYLRLSVKVSLILEFYQFLSDP
jgi:hypothetical protein